MDCMTTLSPSKWIASVVAIGLMLVAIYEAREIRDLKAQLVAKAAELDRVSQSNAMTGLRLTPLEVKDASYLTSKINVAWDPYQSRGVIAVQNLPAPPDGFSYQLWVLDPGAETPISAGLVLPENGSHAFSVRYTSTITPGFAITLEPGQGSPEPTSSILFAVAPVQ